LKCGHVFNLLDARGAISVTERAGYIGRIRTLSRLVAKSYYDSRERLGFPMVRESSIEEPSAPPGRPKERSVPLGGTARSAREHQ